MMIRHVTMLIAIGITSPASAQDLDFILTNTTGKTIAKVEVQPTGQSDWSQNRLRIDTLANTKRTSVSFPEAGTQCKYDVRAEFGDGTVMVWPGIDFCENAYVTLEIKDGKPTFTTD